LGLRRRGSSGVGGVLRAQVADAAEAENRRDE
jgi:hypothetical protein